MPPLSAPQCAVVVHERWLPQQLRAARVSQAPRATHRVNTRHALHGRGEGHSNCHAGAARAQADERVGILLDVEVVFAAANARAQPELGLGRAAAAAPLLAAAPARLLEPHLVLLLKDADHLVGAHVRIVARAGLVGEQLALGRSAADVSHRCRVARPISSAARRCPKWTWLSALLAKQSGAPTCRSLLRVAAQGSQDNFEREVDWGRSWGERRVTTASCLLPHFKATIRPLPRQFRRGEAQF